MGSQAGEFRPAHGTELDRAVDQTFDRFGKQIGAVVHQQTPG
jgi:hypothetical protein